MPCCPLQLNDTSLSAPAGRERQAHHAREQREVRVCTHCSRVERGHSHASIAESSLQGIGCHDLQNGRGEEDTSSAGVAGQALST